MSTKTQREHNGLRNKRSLYTTLNKSSEYSCPHVNLNFSGFNKGVNCLCTGMPMERSSGDYAQLNNKTWPTNNNRFGWK
jgi:hypothetical protein